MGLYELSQVPAWCRMPTREHEHHLGGCWGISNGFVREKGEGYCRSCEYHAEKAEAGATRVAPEKTENTPGE